MMMMKMDNEDGDDDDNEDDDATFAILCYSDRARLVARQSVSCPRAPGYDCQKTAMRCWQCETWQHQELASDILLLVLELA